MYKQLLSVLILCVFFLFSCAEGENSQKLVGKWEGKNEQMCTITKEGDELYLDHFYFNKNATTAGDNSFIDKSGNPIRKGTLIPAGATLNHRKSKLIYDEKDKVFKWDEGKQSINTKLIDDDHLVLEFPGEHRIYSRLKS